MVSLEVKTGKAHPHSLCSGDVVPPSSGSTVLGRAKEPCVFILTVTQQPSSPPDGFSNSVKLKTLSENVCRLLSLARGQSASAHEPFKIVFSPIAVGGTRR